MLKVVVFCVWMLVGIGNAAAQTYSGYTYDSNGNILPGVRVDITGEYSFTDVVATTISNKHGYYSFDVEYDYWYWCIASKSGYYTSYQQYIDDGMGVYVKKSAGEINIAGTWEGFFFSDSAGVNWYDVVLKLKQEGDKVNGKWKDKANGVKGKFWGILDGNVLTFSMTSKRKEYVDKCKGRYSGVAIVGNEMSSVEFNHANLDNLYLTYIGEDCEGEVDDGHGHFIRE